MPHETIEPADAMDVIVDQLAYLIATFRAGKLTPAESGRLNRVVTALHEPFRVTAPHSEATA
jgi:hypothetical protein